VPDIDLSGLRELRARHPEAVAEAAGRRRRRPLFDGKAMLTIVAADHPARGVLAVRGVAGVMADRADLLRRLVVALGRPGVDGVLATADILDDLLLLGALEEKIVLGSMNRGGLQGAVFELDDRFTAYNAEALSSMGFEGGKMLCQVDLEDASTVPTLEACGRTVTELARRKLVAMVEPFVCQREGGRVVKLLTPEAVISSVTVAAALGAPSAYTWLKIPVVDRMEEVMAATTLPVFLLGGDPEVAPDVTYAKWEKALALPGARGLVVGRALLYPPDGDVGAAVDSAVRLVGAG
jgi:Cgl0159-like